MVFLTLKRYCCYSESLLANLGGLSRSSAALRIRVDWSVHAVYTHSNISPPQSFGPLLPFSSSVVIFHFLAVRHVYPAIGHCHFLLFFQRTVH